LENESAKYAGKDDNYSKIHKAYPRITEAQWETLKINFTTKEDKD
jgi:hypothetical protein